MWSSIIICRDSRQFQCSITTTFPNTKQPWLRHGTMRCEQACKFGKEGGDDCSHGRLFTWHGLGTCFENLYLFRQLYKWRTTWITMCSGKWDSARDYLRFYIKTQILLNCSLYWGHGYGLSTSISKVLMSWQQNAGYDTKNMISIFQKQN